MLSQRFKMASSSHINSDSCITKRSFAQLLSSKKFITQLIQELFCKSTWTLKSELPQNFKLARVPVADLGKIGDSKYCLILFFPTLKCWKKRGKMNNNVENSSEKEIPDSCYSKFPALLLTLQCWRNKIWLFLAFVIAEKK